VRFITLCNLRQINLHTALKVRPAATLLYIKQQAGYLPNL
jgi:hypothetical protein